MQLLQQLLNSTAAAVVALSCLKRSINWKRCSFFFICILLSCSSSLLTTHHHPVNYIPVSHTSGIPALLAEPISKSDGPPG